MTHSRNNLLKKKLRMTITNLSKTKAQTINASRLSRESFSTIRITVALYKFVSNVASYDIVAAAVVVANIEIYKGQKNQVERFRVFVLRSSAFNDAMIYLKDYF